MAIAVRTVEVTDTPTLIAVGGQEWATLRILTDADVFIGGPDVATTDTGWSVLADEIYDFGSNPQYGDKLYGVTSTGSANVTVFETGL